MRLRSYRFKEHDNSAILCECLRGTLITDPSLKKSLSILQPILKNLVNLLDEGKKVQIFGLLLSCMDMVVEWHNKIHAWIWVRFIFLIISQGRCMQETWGKSYRWRWRPGEIFKFRYLTFKDGSLLLWRPLAAQPQNMIFTINSVVCIYNVWTQMNVFAYTKLKSFYLQCYVCLTHILRFYICRVDQFNCVQRKARIISMISATLIFTTHSWTNYYINYKFGDKCRVHAGYRAYSALFLGNDSADVLSPKENKSKIHVRKNYI